MNLQQGKLQRILAADGVASLVALALFMVIFPMFRPHVLPVDNLRNSLAPSAFVLQAIAAALVGATSQGGGCCTVAVAVVLPAMPRRLSELAGEAGNSRTAA